MSHTDKLNSAQSLFVAWHTEQPMPRWSPVGRVDALRQANGKRLYRFRYTQGARLTEGFRPFDGMLDLEASYHSEELFPMLANRLLPRSRPEYKAFLRWNGFDPADPPEPLVLLQRSEGIKKTDAIEVFPVPVPDNTGCYLNFFFVHGMRFQLTNPATAAVVTSLHGGDRLTLRREPENPVDPFAIAIEAQGAPLGYAPRYLAHELTRLMRECPNDSVRVFVHRVNPDAPFQQRLLCRMQACWPDGFQPCSGEEFQLITDLACPAAVG